MVLFRVFCVLHEDAWFGEFNHHGEAENARVFWGECFPNSQFKVERI